MHGESPVRNKSRDVTNLAQNLRLLIGSSYEGDRIKKVRENQMERSGNGNGYGYSSQLNNYDTNSNTNIAIDAGENARLLNQTTTEFSPRIP